jgi:cytochrome oxidase Cu insertion factor (SCO1/SenC/PrrC family)
MHPKLRRVLVAGLLACGPASAQAIPVGATAPDFTLLDVNGVSHSLSSLRGNAVLLAFIGYG